MKKISIDTVKLIGLVGTGLGIAATLLGNYSQGKELQKTVEEEVAKALSNKD